MFSRKQKTIFGLLFTIVCLCFLGLAPSSASALDKSDYDDPPASYRFINASTIEVKFPGGRTINFVDREPNDSNSNFKPTGGGVCSLDDSRDGINITSNLISGDYGASIINVGDSVGPGGRCLVDVNPAISITIAANGVTGVGGTGGDEASTPTCESSNSGALTWILCPILGAIDDVIDEIITKIEKQLEFDREKNLGGQVQQAWSIVRNLATGFLVVIMLIMVISQAVNIGPFDAYSVRKLLPKLIAATLLIQLSFPLIYFLIRIFNDLGVGIQQIMYAPFGGSEVMSLSSLLAGENAPSGFNLFTGLAIAGGIVALVFNPIGALILAFSVFVVVFMAFFVIAIREILIILCVITAPIALALWILPGTQRYWNLWRETLIKLLMMFPLIMAMIAAGRIFAYIITSKPNDSLDIVAFILVLVGVFGPLALLPKTFQWGGQIFGNITGGLDKASKGYLERPKGYLQKQKESNQQFKAQERARRISQNPVAASFPDRVRAGRYNYLKSRGARERGYNQTLKEGQSASNEAAAGKLLASGFDRMNRDDQLDALESWAKKGTSKNGISSADDLALQEYALDQLTQQRQIGRLRNIAKADPKISENPAWARNLQKNFGIINDSAPDLVVAGSGKPFDLTAVGAERMVSWEDTTWDEWAGQIRSADPGSTTYQNGVSQAQATISNPRVFDSLKQRNKEIVNDLARTGGTQVREIRMQGGGRETILPGGDALLSPDPAISKQATESVVKNLNSATGSKTADAIAHTLYTAAPGSSEEKAYHGLMEQLSKGADSSPEIHRAYNLAASRYHAYLDAEATRTVQDEFSKGNTDLGTITATAKKTADTAKGKYPTKP